MVTPVYKEGYPVNTPPVSIPSSPLSADGSRVEGESIGVFAGAEDDHLFVKGEYGPQGADYMFTRGESDWTPAAVSLAATLFPENYSLMSNSELTETLWAAATPAQVAVTPYIPGENPWPEMSFYVRRSEEPPVEVGPILPPSVGPEEVGARYFEFRAAPSRTLSAVYYSMREHHWPGDETEPGAESLYEYVGTGNSAPILVGVSGGQGSTDLISKCGTSLDGVSEIRSVALNGVSESGSTALFTADPCGASPTVEEVYARIDNGQPDAHTVAISEPSLQDCSACNTAEGVRQGASPAHLSSDGSRVLFMTSQPLLGDDTSNNLYEYDFEDSEGHRIVRVSAGDPTVEDPTADVERVLHVSSDGSHVYFLASGVLTRTPNSLGQQAQAGQSNLYLYERDAEYPNGRTVFVLPYAEVVEAGYGVINGGSNISENGGFLTFVSYSHLTPDDLSAGAQGFEYDSQVGDFARYSIGQDGFNDDGSTGSPSVGLVANDGSVYFESVDPLVPQAVSGASNVYEYREGGVNLISDGQDNRGATLAFISPSGADVFFRTYSQLVSRDTDDQVDTYDARVDGGFSEASPSSPCEGDACQGELSGTPVLLSPASEFQAGGESATSTATSEPSTKAAKRNKKAARRKSKKKAAKASRPQTARKANRGKRSEDEIGGRR
jgi:hypothetical protein